MAKLFASDRGCKGATLATGGDYRADKNGMIHVENPRDIKALVGGGYVVAGAVVRSSKYWVCDECSWDAVINSCPKCGSNDLRKVG